MTIKEREKAIIDRVGVCCKCTLFVYNNCVPACHDTLKKEMQEHNDAGVQVSKTIMSINSSLFANAHKMAKR